MQSPRVRSSFENARAFASPSARIIFELINGEVKYTKFLRDILQVCIFVTSVTAENLLNNHQIVIPGIQKQRIIAVNQEKIFLSCVFRNVEEISEAHGQLVDALFELQKRQHPRIGSIAEPFKAAVIKFRRLYHPFVVDYPIGDKILRDEVARNGRFKKFLEVLPLRYPR